MSFQETMIAVVVIGLLIHALMIACVFYLKEKTRKNLGASLFVVVPNIMLQASVSFFGSYNSIGEPPKLVHDSEQTQTVVDAEQRIRRLESYTRELEIYVRFSTKNILNLIGFMGLFYSIPLFFIALSLAERKKSKKDKTVEEIE